MEIQKVDSIKKLTNDIIIKALEKNGGLIKHAAESLKCSREALYKRIKLSNSLAEAVNQCRESALDIGQSKLMENVEAGKEASIFFLLKTLGKNRGFIEKAELDIKHVEPDYSKLSKETLRELAKFEN